MPLLNVDIEVPSVQIVDLTYVGVRGDTGPQGPQGPQGPAGGGTASYVHDQSVPAATWTINHNLGYFPNVTVVDSAGNQVIGQVQYISLNSMTINFNASFGGKAYLS